MLSDGRRLGAHLPLGAGMVRAVERAHEIGRRSSRCSATTRRRGVDGRRCPRSCRGSGSGSGSSTSPRRRSTPRISSTSRAEPTFHAQSIVVLTYELRVAIAYGASFVNVHIGSHRGEGPEAGVPAGDGLATCSRSRRPPTSRTRATAMKATTTATAGPLPTRPRGWLRRRLRPGRHDRRAGGDRRRPPRPWASTRRASGTASTRRTSGARATRSTPRRPSRRCSTRSTPRIGLDRLVMVHLNDSRSELGSRLDRHEHLGAGRIGARACADADASRAGPRRVHPRDTGHGRGLRRDEHPAGEALAAGDRSRTCRPRRSPRSAKVRSAPADPGARSERPSAGEGPAPRALRPTDVPAGAGLTAPVERASRSTCRTCWASSAPRPRARAALPGSRCAARGMPTRGTTCSCSSLWVGTARCPFSARRPRRDVPPRRPVLLAARACGMAHRLGPDGSCSPSRSRAGTVAATWWLARSAADGRG